MDKNYFSEQFNQSVDELNLWLANAKKETNYFTKIQTGVSYLIPFIDKRPYHSIYSNDKLTPLQKDIICFGSDFKRVISELEGLVSDGLQTPDAKIKNEQNIKRAESYYELYKQMYVSEKISNK